MPPLRQTLRCGAGGGELLLQGFFALNALVQRAEKRLKFAVGQRCCLLWLMGIVLQNRRRLGQCGKVLGIARVGGGLLCEVDDTKLTEPIQKRGLFRGGGHDVYHLHFLDHRLTS